LWASKRALLTTIALYTFVLSVVAWFKVGREKLVLIGIGNRLLQSGRYNAATTVLEVNTRIYPQSASAHSALARAHYYAGNRSESFMSIRKAREIDPHRLADIVFWKRLTLVPETSKCRRCWRLMSSGYAR
jgi:tetratricopeptide (TPR) repeat protein